MPRDGTAADPPSDPGAGRAPLEGARAALILLLIINFFNYIDRYILAAAVTDIRQELLPDDPR